MLIKTYKYLIFLPLLMFITLVSAYAATTNYSAQVPVANNSQAQWQQGVQQALVQVLINVTNNPDIGNVAAVKSQLSKAGDMVQSFSYVTVKQNNQSQLMLEASFDAKSVEQLIARVGSKAWQKQAPQGLLTWLVVDENNNEKFISSDSKSDYATALQTVAQQKNISLTLPMIDLTDLNALTTNDVATLEPAPIIQASTRYQTQNILAGYISPTADGSSWQGGWWLLYNGKNTQFQTQGNSPAQVITNGINRVAQNLTPTNPPTNANAAASANNTNDVSTEQLTLKITNVGGLADYAEVLKYLRSLLSVTQVDIDSVQGQDLLVKVTTSEQTILLSQLSQSQKLVANPSANGDSSLTYRWAGTLAIDPSQTPPSSNSQVNTQPINTPPATPDNNNDPTLGITP